MSIASPPRSLTMIPAWWNTPPASWNTSLTSIPRATSSFLAWICTALAFAVPVNAARRAMEGALRGS